MVNVGAGFGYNLANLVVFRNHSPSVMYGVSYIEKQEIITNV